MVKAGESVSAGLASGLGRAGLPPAEYQPAFKNCIEIYCDLKAFSNGVFSPLPPAMNTRFAEFTEGTYRLYCYKILSLQFISFPKLRF